MNATEIKFEGSDIYLNAKDQPDFARPALYVPDDDADESLLEWTISKILGEEQTATDDAGSSVSVRMSMTEKSMGGWFPVEFRENTANFWDFAKGRCARYDAGVMKINDVFRLVLRSQAGDIRVVESGHPHEAIIAIV